MLFSGLYDLPLTLFAFALLFALCRHDSLTVYFKEVHFTFIGSRIITASVILTCIGFGVWTSLTSNEQFRLRNFYGTYRIVDERFSDAETSVEIRRLIHGSTLHGAQLLGSEHQRTPISYYHVDGAIAEAYKALPSPRRIAILGLGAGVAAAYAETGDVITYYEIDPDNERIARTWFTYLHDTPASLKVVVGDGRLALQESKELYDIIHVDAFAGDGIPAHLLTLDAIKCYLDRLTKEGLILFHISNRYYDLRPVLKSATLDLGIYAAMNKPLSRDNLRPYEMPSQCVILSTTANSLESLLSSHWVDLTTAEAIKPSKLWTDDYINLLSPLKAKITSM
jgi:hypothetical protein